MQDRNVHVNVNLYMYMWLYDHDGWRRNASNIGSLGTTEIKIARADRKRLTITSLVVIVY